MKTAKIFRSGNSQAVRLPKEFRVPHDEVFIKKTGDTIVLIPKKGDRWKNVKACAGRFKGPLERRQAPVFDERAWPK
ncbi:MAG: antitoxin [Sulfuricaulis sp.]